ATAPSGSVLWLEDDFCVWLAQKDMLDHMLDNDFDLADGDWTARVHLSLSFAREGHTASELRCRRHADFVVLRGPRHDDALTRELGRPSAIFPGGMGPRQAVYDLRRLPC